MATTILNSLETRFRILSDDRRRAILRYLRSAEEQVVTIDELVTHLQTEHSENWETDELTICLHHIHLPELAECGLIEYDPRTTMLRYIKDERIEQWLDNLEAWETE